MDRLPTIDYHQLAPTRDYLQDVAKVVGKLQQLFLPADQHQWQRGLAVWSDGLMSRPFAPKGETYQALINFKEGDLQLHNTSWELAHHNSAQQIFDEMQHWLNEQGLDYRLEKPQLVTQQPQFDVDQASLLADALSWIEDRFEELQRPMRPGTFSPVLLYPHHFDLSLSWYPNQNERQLSIGFVVADNYIAEPYFYITAYPQPPKFDQTGWPSPSFWFNQGFSGGVLKYADLRAFEKPADLLEEFWQAGRLAFGD